MSQVRITVLNNSKPTQAPVGAQLFTEDLPKDSDDENVVISCGDGDAQGAVTIPLAALTMLMANIASQKQAAAAILVPRKPQIVIPN